MDNLSFRNIKYQVFQRIEFGTKYLEGEIIIRFHIVRSIQIYQDPLASPVRKGNVFSQFCRSIGGGERFLLGNVDLPLAASFLAIFLSIEIDKLSHCFFSWFQLLAKNQCHYVRIVFTWIY